MIKDYYEILGIKENDTLESIKSAYHRLARKWHPDIASNKDEAILKFKEINEAYQTLSDEHKRANYDRAKSFYDYAKKNNTHNINNETNKNSNNPSKQKECNLNWKNFFNNTKAYNSKPVRGCDINTEIEISYTDAIYGTEKIVNVLQTNSCPSCKGKKAINGSICKNCNGNGSITSYKKFTVKIPAGIKNYSKLRLAKEGGKGKFGGLNGDLYITVIIKQDRDYHTEGLDVYKKVKIEPYLAVLGGNIEISTLNEKYNVKIAPNTQNGQKIRLSKCGIVQNNKIGDMIITVEIKTPTNLTSEEINLYKRLEQISKEKLNNNG